MSIRLSITSEGNSAPGLNACAAVNATRRGRDSVSPVTQVRPSATVATAPAIQNSGVKPSRSTSVMPVIGPAASARLPAAP